MTATIAFVLKGYPSISETFIAQEIRGLEKAGLKILIIALQNLNNGVAHPINSEIEAEISYLPRHLYNGPLRVLRSWLKVRRVAGYKVARGNWFKDLRRDFSYSRILRFTQALVLAAELPETIERMHAHYIHKTASVTRYAGDIMGKDWTCSAHANDIWLSPDWELSEKINDCGWVSVCTRYGAEHLRSLTVRPEKVRLIYHGLDLARFSASPSRPSTSNGSDPARPVELITVCRAVEKKGVDTLLDALALLPDAMHWRWTHVGGGRLQKGLKRQAERLNIAGRISWRGALTQEEVLELYRVADLFILPCRVAANGNMDGLPNVLMEAQSQGLACISTPVSGVPELIIDGKTGALAPPDDAKALSDVLVRVCRDPALRKRFGRAGEKRVRSQFSHEGGISALMQLFDHGIPDDNRKAGELPLELSKVPLMTKRVLLHVQHLLGIGHIVRASRITKALGRAGFDVCVAYGGRPVDGIDWGNARVVQLPSISAGEDGFSTLVSEDGSAISEKIKDARRSRLLALFKDYKPEVLLIEAYPFAHRRMSFELRPLLELSRTITPRPLVVSSIRDILQELRKRRKIAKTTKLVEEFFDIVLVHGCEQLTPLSLTFPQADRIAGKLRYTGMIGPEADVQVSREVFDVIVSAGGGAVGSQLLKAALTARALRAVPGEKWLLLGGPNLGRTDFDELQNNRSELVSVERFRPDLHLLMKSARLSISQAGYNTVADVLAASCRSILVPFAELGQNEQTRRAAMLAQRGRAIMLEQKNLSGRTLAAAIRDALLMEMEDLQVDMAGAVNSAEIIQAEYSAMLCRA